MVRPNLMTSLKKILLHGLAVFCMSCLAAVQGHAHVTDTSLLRIQVLPESLVLDWNADLATLQQLTALDSNGDGRVEKTEWERAIPEIERLVREKLRLEIQGGAPDLGEARPPEWQSDSTEALQGQWQSVHVNVRFERRFPPGGRLFRLSADLLSMLGPKHNLIVSIVHGASSDQAVLSQATPAFEYDPAAVSGGAPRVPARQLFGMGVEHILTGYDHLLFLLMLLVAVGRWREMVGVVTAFTLAHSVTLGLAAMEVVRLPQKWVECCIAASIAWVALENCWQGRGTHRWWLTFGFGLIHGFGFAGALRELELPREGLLWNLLLFNGGVEAGQLLVVAPILPLLMALSRSRWSGWVRWGLSVLGGLLALWWLVERLQA
ncbi:MAG: hypothetical protein RLZZ399_1250 [Verrucomicrobiota bacterium]|jgi:hydrogenase/urease accessory protein HupE